MLKALGNREHGRPPLPIDPEKEALQRQSQELQAQLQVMDAPRRWGVEFVSFREQLETGGPLGRAIVVIVGAIAELERSSITERVRQA
jgi:DNA invertase Pin-like site-specific DNA recombinase